MKRVIVIIATLIMGQAFAATNHYSEIRGVDVTNYEISMNFTKFLITRIDPILVETTLSVKITDDMDQLELNFNHQASKVLKVQELTSHLELPYKLDYYSFDNRYGFINISFNRKLLAGEEVKVKIFTEFHPWLYTFLPSGGYSSTWSGVADIPFSCSNSGDYCKLKTYRHNFRSIFPSHDHFSDTASFKFNFVVAKKKEDSNYYATAAGSLVGGRYSELDST